jgi:hypothetical protein
MDGCVAAYAEIVIGGHIEHFGILEGNSARPSVDQGAKTPKIARIAELLKMFAIHGYFPLLITNQTQLEALKGKDS